MSTIKSSAEDLTLNADGSGNDIKFQSNAVEKASIDQDGNLVLSGTLTSVGIDDNANANAITIDSNENVGIGASIGESGMGSNAQALFVGAHGGVITSGAYESVSLAENAYIGTAASDTWKYRDTSHAARLEIKAGVHTHKVAASGTADADITWTTGFEVLNDGKARAKNGLLFGTDTAAANALDDYEEGTWTPSGGNFTVGTVHAATYTKIGNLVTLSAYFAASSGNGSSATISGMPFSSIANGFATGVINSHDGNTTVTNPHVRVASGSTTITLHKNMDGSLLGNEVDSGHIIFSVSYHTAA